MLFYRKENKNSTEILTFKIRTRDELPEERCPHRSQIPEERRPRRSKIPEERCPRRSKTPEERRPRRSQTIRYFRFPKIIGYDI